MTYKTLLMKKNILFFILLITGITAFAQLSISKINYSSLPVNSKEKTAANPFADVVKPIAFVYQASNETIPVGGWILNQTKNSLKVRAFHNNHDWEFIGYPDGRIDLKIGGDNFAVKKLAIVSASIVTQPTHELFPKNGYVSILAEGRIPTPAKIITGYSSGKNRGGSFTAQLPYSDASKTIEISWNALQGTWGCSKGTSSYIPVGARINAVYTYAEKDSEEMLTNIQPASSNIQPNMATAAANEMPDRPSMAKITFSDSKEYYGNIISQQASQIDIKLIPTGALYSIDKKGLILNSSGKYTKGSKVQSIMTKQAGQSIYTEIDQANFDYGTLGFVFADGQVQYANSFTVGVTFLSSYFLHEKFTYYMYYIKGEWKIDIQGGQHKNGTVIKDIFELDSNFKRFY